MSGNRLTVMLLVVVVALGALAGWLSLVKSGREAPLAVSPTPVPEAKAAGSLTSQDMPALEELSETLERPLFSRSRRPQPPETVVEAVPEEKLPEQASSVLSVELSAVVLETDRQYALFRQTSQKGLLKAELGEKVEGWVVREIRADGVRLERGTQSEDLPLRTFKAPVVPARAKPTRRRGKAPVPDAAAAAPQRRPRRAVRSPRQRPVVRQ